MSFDPTGLGSTGLLIFLVVKEALHYANKKQKEQNGDAGSKSVDFWELTLGELVEAKIQPLNVRMEKMAEQAAKTNEKIIERLDAMILLLDRAVNRRRI